MGIVTEKRKKPSYKWLRWALPAFGVGVIATGIYFWNGSPETVIFNFIAAMQRKDWVTAERLHANSPINKTTWDLWATEYPKDVPIKIADTGIYANFGGQKHPYVSIEQLMTPKQLEIYLKNVTKTYKRGPFWFKQLSHYNGLLYDLPIRSSIELFFPDACVNSVEPGVHYRCGTEYDDAARDESVLGKFALQGDPNVFQLEKWLSKPPELNKSAVKEIELIAKKAKLIKVSDPKKFANLKLKAVSIIESDLGEWFAYESLNHWYAADVESKRYRSYLRFYMYQILTYTRVGSIKRLTPPPRY